MTRVLFSGVLDGDTGPAIVNRAYAAECDWLSTVAQRPNFVVSMHFIRNMRRYQGVLVSSISGYHVLLVLLARLAGRDAAYLAHGVGHLERRINGARSFRGDVVESLLIRLASRVIAVSPVLADQICDEHAVPRSRVVSVLNGTDAEPWPDMHVPPAAAGHLRLLTVGTRPIKNLRAIEQAIDEAKVGPVEFVVVGSSEIRQSANPDVRRIDIQQMPHRELRSWMASSDIYIQLSLVEPFGLAVCEAAEAGAALLLSTNVGAIPALDGLTDENIVRDHTDIPAVARQLAELVSSVRSGEAGRQSCNRSWKTAARELQTVLRYE